MAGEWRAYLDSSGKSERRCTRAMVHESIASAELGVAQCSGVDVRARWLCDAPEHQRKTELEGEQLRQSVAPTRGEHEGLTLCLRKGAHVERCGRHAEVRLQLELAASRSEIGIDCRLRKRRPPREHEDCRRARDSEFHSPSIQARMFAVAAESTLLRREGRHLPKHPARADELVKPTAVGVTGLHRVPNYRAVGGRRGNCRRACRPRV